jgi:hypothetical protein
MGRKKGFTGRTPSDYIRRVEDLEHPPSHRAVIKIAEALGVDVGAIDPGAR